MVRQEKINLKIPLFKSELTVLIRFFNLNFNFFYKNQRYLVSVPFFIAN